MTKSLISFPGPAMNIADKDLAAVGEAAHAVIREAKNAGVYVFGGGINEAVEPLMVAADAPSRAGPIRGPRNSTAASVSWNFRRAKPPSGRPRRSLKLAAVRRNSASSSTTPRANRRGVERTPTIRLLPLIAIGKVRGNVAFETYENQWNRHVSIHHIGCGQLRKRGGEHVDEQKHYQMHSRYPEALMYANQTGLPLKICSFCCPDKKSLVRLNACLTIGSKRPAKATPLLCSFTRWCSRFCGRLSRAVRAQLRIT